MSERIKLRNQDKPLHKSFIKGERPVDMNSWNIFPRTKEPKNFGISLIVTGAYIELVLKCQGILNLYQTDRSKKTLIITSNKQTTVST